MLSLLRDQAFGQFELMGVDKFAQEIRSHSAFGFVRCLRLQIGAARRCVRPGLTGRGASTRPALRSMQKP